MINREIIPGRKKGLDSVPYICDPISVTAADTLISSVKSCQLCRRGLKLKGVASHELASIISPVRPSHMVGNV